MSDGDWHVGSGGTSAQVEGELEFATALTFAIPAGMARWIAASVPVFRFVF